MPNPNCTDPTTPTTWRIHLTPHKFNFTLTLLYPLHNFSTIFTDTRQATASSSSSSSSIIIHHLFSYTPFHVTDDPIEFQFFQLFPSTVVVLDPFRLLHPIHVAIHFYFLTFNRQFPLLFNYTTWFQKFHPSYLVVFFVLLLLLYPKIGSIRSIQFGVPHFSSSSLSLCLSMCSWLSTKILSKMFMEKFKEKCLRTHSKEKC